jgi:phytoene synthase
VTPLFDLARARDPDRALAAAFAPPARREALSALICFDHELARARAAAREPMAALIRLQWWRDAIAEAAESRPPRRHEVAEPLARLVAAGVFDAAALTAMVDAREAEAEGGMPTRAAFRAWARGTAGGVAVASARLLGAPSALLPAVARAGEVFGVARALRSLPEQARQGRSLLPADALADSGGDAARAAALLAREALSDMPALRAALRRLPRAALPAALTLPLARGDLRRAARGVAQPPGRLFGERLAVIGAWVSGRA